MSRQNFVLKFGINGGTFRLLKQEAQQSGITIEALAQRIVSRHAKTSDLFSPEVVAVADACAAAYIKERGFEK